MQEFERKVKEYDRKKFWKKEKSPKKNFTHFYDFDSGWNLDSPPQYMTYPKHDSITNNFYHTKF